MENYTDTVGKDCLVSVSPQLHSASSITLALEAKFRSPHRTGRLRLMHSCRARALPDYLWHKDIKVNTLRKFGSHDEPKWNSIRFMTQFQNESGQLAVSGCVPCSIIR